MRMKRAFTIVELLMVIGIIGVLTGIVTTAAAGAMKNARSRRADALCQLVKLGSDTYYARERRWPIPNLPAEGSRRNYESQNHENDSSKLVLTAEEVKNWIKELAEQSRQGAPVMDISGLFVARSDVTQGKYKQVGYGLDFMHAIHGTRKTSKKMKLGEMSFGYPDPESGHFRHFKIVYSYPTDSITVSRMDYYGAKAIGEN